jgi:2,3-bisphosphoglycerate-dependent phosphoglycerate mutase
MKSLYILLTILFMNVSWGQDNITTIYMVRHAEKADGPADPHISADGQQRAQKWATFFADKNITAIYSTATNRTRETVQPLATASGLQVADYDATNLYLGSLVKRHNGKAIVIVGHSNTVPAQINKLLGKDQFTDIPETEFSQLYTITIVDGVPTAKVEKI